MRPFKGMFVDILKSHIGSCSNGGISTLHQEVLLASDNGIEINNVDNIPVVRIVPGNVEGMLKAVVLFDPNGYDERAGDMPMFGGCYIVSSDSRFPADYPVPLHDRYER